MTPAEYARTLAAALRIDLSDTGRLDILTRAVLDVAKEQRHACAEECAGSEEHVAAGGHYHALVMNTPLPPLKPLS